MILSEKTITPATLWAFLPLSFSLLSFLFLPKGIPEIERGRGYRKYPLPLNFRDDSCLQALGESSAYQYTVPRLRVVTTRPLIPSTISKAPKAKHPSGWLRSRNGGKVG